MRHLRYPFVLLLLLLCNSLYAQTHHYQYSHDAAGNRASRVYQARAGASGNATDKTDTLSAEGFERMARKDAEGDSLSVSSWQSTKHVDTIKYGPLVKTQAEKDAYDSLMMAEAMKVVPFKTQKGASQRSSTSYSVGEIPLQYGVSCSGARTYSVPIFTAPDGQAKGLSGWDLFGYIAAGATIGGASAFAGGYVATALAPVVAAAGYGGFVGGAITGAFSGAAAGAVNGLGFGALSTGTLDGAFNAGAQGMAIGILSGAFMGGALQGISAKLDGKNFWTGRQPRPAVELSQHTIENSHPLKIEEPTIQKAANLNDHIQYDFANDPDGSYVTLYRGTTGTENGGAPLYMTDSPEYAATYVRNGGTVVQAKIPSSTLKLLMYNNDVSTYSGIHMISSDIRSAGYSYTEYVFKPWIKPAIINLFTPY